jgi:hypothetical protein
LGAAEAVWHKELKKYKYIVLLEIVFTASCFSSETAAETCKKQKNIFLRI